MCGCLSCVPHWGPSPQPRHVPCLGIEQQPFGLQANAQSTPARVMIFLKGKCNMYTHTNLFVFLLNIWPKTT